MDTLFLALRVLVSLAVVLGVIWYAQRRISRGTRAKQGRTITVVGRQGIGSKASVAVIDVDGKRFLLGVTEQAVSILHTSDAPVVVATADAFSIALDQHTDQHDDQQHADQRGEHRDAPIAIAASRAVTASSSPLAGSLLSADTWRRAFATLRP